ncbi:hypothetical protein AMECASPLE_038070 [Ameca splendens]|uniref:Uncharacterized protein n=1 Tax=Ameca splendens TaxID=208324 RepID=A0ABV0Z6X7_9TELE
MGTTTPVCQSRGTVLEPHAMLKKRVSHNIQRLEVLRANLIHPGGLATMELFNHFGDLAWVTKASNSESPVSVSTREGITAGFRRSSKYSFHRPIISPVEVSSSPS